MMKLVLSLIFIFSIARIEAQVFLRNASFEGEPQEATMPDHWYACEKGTTPDIMPGVWGVDQEPAEGETYMGIITREDGTWESIGQKLSGPLEKNYCYTFSMHLAHSRAYYGYNMPIKLRIWGGTRKCLKHQLLDETEFVSHTDWRKYDFSFTVKKSYRYIIIEAAAPDGVYFGYKGNILVDNISTINYCKISQVWP